LARATLVSSNNWSPKGGSIIEVKIAFRRKDNPSEVFYMSWKEFAKMLEDERRCGQEGRLHNQ